MESKDVVQILLRTFFDNMELKSYTIHDKSGLSTVTLRFCNTKENVDSTPVTYIKKKTYHQNRDKARSDNHRRSSRTRKKTQLFDASNVEKMRDDNVAFSTPTIISPESVVDPDSASVLNPWANSFCMGSSPELPCVKPAFEESSTSTSDHDINQVDSQQRDVCFMSNDHISPPSDCRAPPNLPCDFSILKIEDIQNCYELFVRPDDESEGFELFEKRFDLPIPECIDTETFRTHMAKVKWLWPVIRCDTCKKNVLECMVADGTRMKYCPCLRFLSYFCEKCSTKEQCFCGQNYDFIT